ncbi:putative AMP-dependent synthetase/ligase, AMP-binding enzyme domain-containing protein [Rosa chinensis]|uniref:Putative AMP-dependent synthetase/ligase, AMP-binding enzyme domain-containing protein n=1 Tax=Rosa chinensis TaxID=74649 RepID=A0A2P6R0N5_ROSCH|nr:4-coumarate--CoA ligase-like 9 [Rosa chinensis]PRQ39966.1 putative AMP-dependent synthetase/ligase, AMP-binding enzyme domain-containing protein [Rosa chinensis]
MACHNNTTSIDPNSGFCSNTKTFHSLRPKAPLPSETTPLSITHYIFSHLQASPPPPSTPALLDPATRRHILYPEFTRRVKTLAAALESQLNLSSGHTAFVISPNSLDLPILYFSLFSLGVTVSPSNPASTTPEISRQIHLSRPVIAFATSATAHKLPNSLRYGVVLLDSPEFQSMMTCAPAPELPRVRFSQSHTAAVLYSSGTTGAVKGVELTHRNWISVLASAFAVRNPTAPPAVMLCAVPFFHVYGFGVCMRVLGFGETLASISGRFDLRATLRAVEEFRISHVSWAPPVVVAVVKLGSEIDGYDLSSLQVVACGGAPLAKSVIDKLKKRLPNVQVAQGYGLTETTGRVFGTVGPNETRVEGATGKLMSNFEAKIVDPETGSALPPLMTGEIWLRGPIIMKGYIGDEEANATTMDTEGWFKTGDLCYIDKEGYLFFVDRIKELIKYKGYQVAPAELEHLFQSHPDIADAAVVPYPDEEAGQVPMAFVVRRLGSVVDESQVKDFIAKQVAPYKKIRRVAFINEVPKSAQGKLMRKELVKLALSML